MANETIETTATEVTYDSTPTAVATTTDRDYGVATTESGDGEGFDVKSGVIGAAVTAVIGAVAFGIKKGVSLAKKKSDEKKAKIIADYEAQKAANAAEAAKETEAKAEEPKAEEPKAEEPKAEQPKEEPKKDEKKK